MGLTPASRRVIHTRLLPRQLRNCSQPDIHKWLPSFQHYNYVVFTRSLMALPAPTSSWQPFGPALLRPSRPFWRSGRVTHQNQNSPKIQKKPLMPLVLSSSSPSSSTSSSSFLLSFLLSLSKLLKAAAPPGKRRCRLW